MKERLKERGYNEEKTDDEREGKMEVDGGKRRHGDVERENKSVLKNR